MKYLEVIHQSHLQRLRDRTVVRLPDGTPNKADLEAQLTVIEKERQELIIPLLTQIRYLGEYLGYDNTTGDALYQVAKTLQDNPDATPKQFDVSWFKRPRTFNEGEKRLYQNQEFAQQVFELYKTKVQPELIDSKGSK